MRRLRPYPLEDLLLSQAVPGFLLAVAWTVMYEIYHEEGSYYTTLMQEILASEGVFPYFLVSAVLMAFPVGFVVDCVRHVVGEVWLGLPRLANGVRGPDDRRGRVPATPLHWIEALPALPRDFERRYALYRHAWATLLTPAKAAGNMALVLLTLTAWFVIKVTRMGGWRVFSPAFVVGTPFVGLGLVLALLIRYARGVAEFHRRVAASIFPITKAGAPGLAEDAPLSPS